MGTNIYDKDGISITRFYGGKKRGVCYQINLYGGGYIQLTQMQYAAMITFLGAELYKDILKAIKRGLKKAV